MIQSQSTILLNDLLQQDAASVRAWLRRTQSDSLKLSAEFNWLGLAEAAAFESQSTSNVTWAEVAISVYEQLATETANSNARESLMISSMLLRSAMIAKLGSVPGHPVLDIDAIIHWFYDNQTMTHDSAAQKAGHWKICKLEEIRELRRIKNRLGVISVLADSNKYALNEELKHWLSLREKLP